MYNGRMADISQMPYLAITVQTNNTAQPRVVWYREYQTEQPDEPFPDEPWVDVVLELERLQVRGGMTAVHHARKDLWRLGVSIAHTITYDIVLEHPHHSSYRERWKGLPGMPKQLEGTGKAV